jgi:hypothetical protein
VLVLVGIGAVVTLTSDDDDSATNPIDPSSTDPGAVTTTQAPTTAPATTDATPTSTEAPATTETPTTSESPATTVAPPGGTDSRCGYIGVDDFDDMQVEVEFTNPLGAVPAIDVEFALVDGSGTRFYTGSESFTLPQEGESFRSDVDTVAELPADVDGGTVTCAVLEISEGFSFGDAQPAPAASDCQIDEIDSFGDVQIILSTVSPFDSVENLDIFYALRGDDGVRFGDSSSIVDLVGPGESVRVDQDTLTEVPAWVTPTELSCEIIGVAASDF